MNILKWIDVGKVSAERDDLLSSYYYDNGLLEKVATSASCALVLGRKGAGKTAVFRYLSENATDVIGANDVLIPLSFESYNWKIHSLLKNPDAAESLAYRQSWRFIILVEAVKACELLCKQHRTSVPPSISSATKLLEKLFDKPVPSIFDIVSKKLLTLSKLSLPKGGFDAESVELSGGEVSFEEIEKDASLQSQLSGNLTGVMMQLEKALEKALPLESKVFLIFDGVDEAWDTVSFDSSKKVIGGLVGAAEAFSRQFGANIRVVVFLREDIFEVLDLNDLNKLREDSGALLKWDNDSLYKMLLRRINFFGAKAGAKPIEDVDTLFDKAEMRQRARPSKYILKRTMMRPRDIICFYKKIIDSMKEKAADPFADKAVEFSTLEADSIYVAEPAYSEWLKQELLDEWKVQRPEIRDLLSAIQNGGSTNLTEQSFARALVSVNIKYHGVSIRESIQFLYENSVIGFRIGGSTAWKYRCFYPTQGFVASDEYRVHDGLIRALNLTEPRGSE